MNPIQVILNRLSRPRADGHSDSDTFAGRTAGPQDLNPAERTVVSAAWARAASEVLHEQGVGLVTARSGGRTVTEPIVGDRPPDIGIIDRHLAWLIPSPGGRDVSAVASELGTARATGSFRRIVDGTHLAAPVAVVTDRRPLSQARHGHRTLGLQGPWGCLSKSSRSHQAPPLELLAADSHVVDLQTQADLGARIQKRADVLLAAVPGGTARGWGRGMTRSYLDAWRAPEWGFARGSESFREELFALRRHDLTDDVVRLAWAAGVAVHQVLLDRCDGWRSTCRDNGGGAVGPGLLVPLPGRGPATPAAVRFRGDTPETLADFAERLARDASDPRSSDDAPQARARRGPGRLGSPQEWSDGAARVDLVQLGGGVEWPVFTAATPPAGADGRGGLSLCVCRDSDGSGTMSLHTSGDLAQRAWAEDLLRLIEVALA